MRSIPLYLTVLMLTCSSAVVSGDIVLRTLVTPQEAWIGQRVTLQIDVLSADGWAKISKVGEVDLHGAYVIRTDNQGTRLQETIDGVAYTGQRYELSIYPQAAGTVAVPAIPVVVTTKGWGPDAADSVQNASAPAATIMAKIPPGAEDVQGLVSTTRLTAEQEWEPSIEAPKVGDALKRTVILQAADVSAMAFAPLQHSDIRGVGIYPAEPELKDSADRGSLTGTRTEVVTYVLEQVGEAQIPDILLTWWNVADRQLEQVELPGQILNVAAGPAGASDTIGSMAFRQLEARDYWLLLIILVVTAALLLRFRQAMMQHWAAWQKARYESEKRYFQQAIKSLRTSEIKVALRDVMRWLDRINDKDRPAQLEHFLRRYADVQTQQSASEALRDIESGGHLLNKSALIDGLSSARNRWLEQRGKRKAPAQLLPKLNPTQQRAF